MFIYSLTIFPFFVIDEDVSLEIKLVLTNFSVVIDYIRLIIKKKGKEMQIQTMKKRIKSLLKSTIKSIKYRKLYTNTPSIISNNCSGVFLYKKFNCKYLSPTINLQISPVDYIKFCKNLEYYLSIKIDEIEKPDNIGFKALGGEIINFPVGKLDDLTIYFQHYKDFKSAESKWEERKLRINYDKLFFILIDTFCDVDTVKDFFSIPYKNKIFMTGNKELLINENCILINNDNQDWFKGDWIKSFNFKKWFLDKNK